MTRQFATTSTSVWDDEDWWELDGEQQRVFMMLYTQKDITAAGTLPLTLGRWANSTKGCTIEGLSKTLRELSDAHYIVVDWRREVLLVRSFVRWDKGYTNTKRLKAIQTTGQAVGSKLLSGVLAHELDRLGVPHGIAARPIDVKSMEPGCPIDTPSDPKSTMRKEPDGRAIDTVSIDAGSGYVSSYFPEPEPQPEPGTGNRGPQPADVPSAPAGKPAARPTRIPAAFEITEDMRRWAAVKTPGLDIDWHTESFIDFWRAKSGSNATKLDWPGTWRNWMRQEHAKPTARRVNGHSPPPTRPSTADQRVAATLNLREKYLAEEQAQQRRLEIEA